MRNDTLFVGVVVVMAIVSIAIFAPWLSAYEPDAMDMENRLAGPSRVHPLGTDNFGRDLWTRSAYGARVSLSIAMISIGMATLVGTAVGLSSGFYGGWIDMLLMRGVDLFLGFPPIVLAMALVAALGPGTVSVTIALTAVFWTESARVVRAITLSEAPKDYVHASRASGATDRHILIRQILPRVAGPLAVLASLGVGSAIVAESGLSFLGFGVQPPTPTWGWTLAYGMRYLRSDLWLSTVPGLFILVTVLGFNLIGDGLRERFDPRGSLGDQRMPKRAAGEL